MVALVATQSAHAQSLPNLRADSLQAPLEAVAGSQISVQVGVSAPGTLTPGAFSYRLLLTPNGAVSSGLEVGSFGPVSLAAGESETFTAEVTIPANASGRFFLAVELDPSNAVLERNELDNTKASSADLFIRAPQPSLVGSQASLGTLEARIGDLVGFELRVSNQGEVAANVPVALYLRPRGSRSAAQPSSPIISRSDAELARTSVSVGPGQTVQVQLSGAVPGGLSVGDYAVGAFIDPEGTVTEGVLIDNLVMASAALNIYEETLEFVTNQLPGATQFLPYFVKIDARGGNGHYTYRLVQSTLPEGLSLSPSGDSAGVISGTPVRFGGYPLTIEVESRGLVQRKSLQLNVADSPLELTIVTPDLPAGTLSLDYDIELAAAGGQPSYTWSVSGGRLPPGLDISTDGVISGVPLKDGEFTIEITVKDADGTVVVREFTITVEAPNVVILTGRVPALPLNEPVDFQVIASGGQEPYGWTALSDPPPGLRLTEDGRLEGTPTQTGRFALRVQVTDSSEASSQDTGLLQIEVADAGVFEMTTQRLDPGPVRVEYVREVRVEGGIEPIEWTLAPGNGLPTDFVLEAEGRIATIRGTSVRSVAHGFTLRATDASGRQREGTFAIRIDQFTAPPVGSGCSATGTSGSPLFLLFGLLVLGFLRRRA